LKRNKCYSKKFFLRLYTLWCLNFKIILVFSFSQFLFSLLFICLSTLCYIIRILLVCFSFPSTVSGCSHISTFLSAFVHQCVLYVLSWTILSALPLKNATFNRFTLDLKTRKQIELLTFNIVSQEWLKHSPLLCQ